MRKILYVIETSNLGIEQEAAVRPKYMRGKAYEELVCQLQIRGELPGWTLNGYQPSDLFTDDRGGVTVPTLRMSK